MHWQFSLMLSVLSWRLVGFPLLISRAFSWWSFVLFRTLSWKKLDTLAFWLLSSVASNQGVCWTLPVLLLSALWPRSLSKHSAGTTTGLISFPDIFWDLPNLNINWCFYSPWQWKNISTLKFNLPYPSKCHYCNIF